MKNISVKILLLCGLLGGMCAANASAAVDVDAAKTLGRQNNCFKCHGTEKDKDGPSFKKVGEKYRGKADAEKSLVDHLTHGKKVKFPDGHEEEHRIIKTKDMAEVSNLVNWILSL